MIIRTYMGQKRKVELDKSIFDWIKNPYDSNFKWNSGIGKRDLFSNAKTDTKRYGCVRSNQSEMMEIHPVTSTVHFPMNQREAESFDFYYNAKYDFMFFISKDKNVSQIDINLILLKISELLAKNYGAKIICSMDKFLKMQF